MPRTIFLSQPTGLATAVADHLLAAGSRDLGDTEVWVPTSGAARRIRRALADHGVLSPRFTQPMRALLPEDPHLARRFEREAAWARTLAAATTALLDPLFGRRGAPQTDGDRLKAASTLCDLEDLLAEAALDLSSPRLPETCELDQPRWEALATLRASCRGILHTHGLHDPNDARLEEAANPSRAPRRLVIACIPDLPAAAATMASAMESRGTTVEILVWLPHEAAAGFDAWGRPEAPPDGAELVPTALIAPCADAETEARSAMEFCLSSEAPGDYALVLADASSSATFARAIQDRGGHPFLPAGQRLETTEPAIMALEWERFRSSRELATLRRLVQLPRFNRLVRRDTDLRHDDILAACDQLASGALLDTLDRAREFLATPLPPPAEGERPRDQRARILHQAATLFMERTTSLLDQPATSLLATAWRSGGEGLEAARRVVALRELVEASPLFQAGGADADAAFVRALRAEPTFDTSQPGDVELPNWLEAPWIDASHLALCGCVHGALPSTATAHAFLPDNVRARLGLADNASRLARDAHLLGALARSRPPHSLRISFPRFDAEGSPTTPSALLFRCRREDLPARVTLLFNADSTASRPPAPSSTWQWNLPANQRKQVEKISPTDFSEYLSCPFRHYLKRVLWLDTFDPSPREMDALVFGSLVHDALERFGTTSPHETDENVIARLAIEHLDAGAHRLFGRHPAPAVLVQLEGARERLRAFARIQAAQAAAGWEIISVERKLEADDGLLIGPLKLSGKIDRIERNARTGEWRVMDYKTHATPKSPEDTHLGPRPGTEWVDEAEIDLPSSNKKPRPKRWRDLQLPLYLAITRHWHAAEIGDAPLRAAYFTLSADPAESAILEFPLLDDPAIQASAMACAEAIARKVADGIFWPPQPVPGRWDDPFAPLFLNGDPAACIHPSTISFLEGDR
jgi:ATP-dependent helicase/nuclease subunit B